jgi:hypothetical protein
LKLPIEDLKRQAEDIYESRWFPMYCLTGGVLLTGMTGDFIWVFGGLGGFLFFGWKRGFK